MYLLKGYVAARAQLLTFILFIWTIYFIEQYLKTKKKRYGIALIIIPIIIANVHLAVWPFFFVLFLPYIGEYVIAVLTSKNYFRKLSIKRYSRKIAKGKISKEKALKYEEKINKLEEKESIAEEKTNKRREHPYKISIEKNDNVKGLIIIAIICAFTGLLTPLGDTPYTYLINTLRGNTMDSISEHLPMVLINAKDFMCVLAIFLAILLLTDTKIKLRDFFMVGGLLLMALSTRRQMSMFILICSVILNRLVCNFTSKYDPEGCRKMEANMVKIPGIIITIAVVLIVSLYMAKPKFNDKFISTKNYPVEACDFILNNVDIQSMRLYNEYNFGSYVLYRGIPVFIDSRADLYAPEFNGGRNIFTDYINTSNLNLYYETKFKEYKITHVLIYKNSKLNMLISKDIHYNLLYSDDAFCFYERLSSNE